MKADIRWRGGKVSFVPIADIAPGRADRRVKELHLTKDGGARVRTATVSWKKAQARLEEVFGRKRSADLRALLGGVVSTHL